MLKVNTDKISVEDLAKKYDLVLDDNWHEFFYLSFKKGGEAIDFQKETKGVGFCDYDVLFDMIKNGDVVKKEEKK